jgi:hypothetical protein
MTPIYQPGECLLVSFEAVVVERPDDPHGGYRLKLVDGAHLDLPLADPAPLSVRRLVPADGEPQPGQIWADRHGGEWFVTLDHRSAEAYCFLRAPDGRARDWSDLHSGPDGPISLVRPAAQPPALDDSAGQGH